MRRFLIGAASVLALGIAGAAMDDSADAGSTMANGVVASATQASQMSPMSANLDKDDIRQAQLELRFLGLYNGSLDGVVGPQTKQALVQFQKSNGLSETATLDRQTMDALVANPGIGQGSSMPPSKGAGSMTSAPGANDFGERGAPK